MMRNASNNLSRKRDGVQYVWQQLLIIGLVVLVALLLFVLGLMLGYGVIGDGESMWTILSPDKWQELIGKMTGK
ncbi:DNA-directed RNA polymerase subunit beta [Streptococcus moroccensis]|uniref:DNA-directed RNA polymerase subunit beta n=1 Tax=Streptococcus moroccensis TaxID=1451356 RepID=A0ABT9YR91_9STRE|nr:DNA-directed RNA polymerase subunit beta [Streptococcus moroccensis]MDQ0222509.1 hypothetical protein [Streptococcus moroccensis]